MGIRTALSVKYAQGDLIIVDSMDIADHKTKVRPCCAVWIYMSLS
jgi:ribosomal protein L4